MDIDDLRNTGLSQRDTGRLEEAITTFTKLKNEFPDDQRVYVDLGICYRQLAKYHLSEKVLKELLGKGILQDNWKALAQNQLFYTEQALLSERCKRPMSDDFYSYQKNWLDIIHANDEVASSNTDQVWQTNFNCAQSLGSAALFAESFWLMLKKLPKEQVEHLSTTILVISNYHLSVGQLERVKELITLLPSDSYIYTKLLIDLGSASQDYHKNLITGYEKAKELNNEGLVAHANTALLANSLNAFELDKASEYLSEVNTFFTRKSDYTPHPFHVIKTNYLKEMELCEGIEEMLTGSEERNTHESYLHVLDLNKNQRQKVVISAYYLSKQLDGIQTNFLVDLLETETYSPEIPKTIIQYWDKDDIPLDIKQCMDSVRHAAPNYKHIIFNKEKAAGFISKNYPSKYFELFKACKHPAQQADVFRVLYLYSKGGIWIDADEEHLAIDSMPLESLFKEETLRFLKVFQLEIQNNFIVVGKNNPILGRMIDSLDLGLCSDDKHVWWNTGPGALTYCLAQMYAETKINQDSKKSHTKLKLLHNHTYTSMFRTPKLGYKETALSWQVNSASN